MYQKYAGTLAAILISAAIAVSGCGSSTRQPAAGTTSGTPTTTQQPTSTTRPSGAPATTVTRPSSTTPVATKPDFPPAVPRGKLEHGGTYWGVYVTVVRTDDNYQIKPEDQKRLDAAEKSLTDLGYEPDAGAYDVNCEQGLREALKLDPQRNYATVRIFFAEQAKAEQFVKAYQPGIVGTAKVTLYCMD